MECVFPQIEPFYLGIIGIAACLGHIFPLFFGFKGGKGVATALGAMLPIGTWMAGLLILTWLIVLWRTGYSSVAALVTVALAPVYTLMFKPLYTVPVLMLSILIIACHKDNIARLRAGQESKVASKTEANHDIKNDSL